MTQVMPLAITISRQLGSGGAYLGQQLAAKLNALYLDREIVIRAAEELKVSESELESRDESIAPIWFSFLSTSSYVTPSNYIPPSLYQPSDREIFEAEASIIKKAANNYNAVIVGRGGSYVLRNHPRHASIFLYADTSFRVARISEVFKVSEEKARKIMETSDQSRSRYLHMLTGEDWSDARHYHLGIDTGILGFEAAEKVILDYIQIRFGDVIPSPNQMAKQF